MANDPKPLSSAFGALALGRPPAMSAFNLAQQPPLIRAPNDGHAERISRSLTAYDPKTNKTVIDRKTLDGLPPSDLEMVRKNLADKHLYYDVFRAGPPDRMLAFGLAMALVPGAPERYLDSPAMKGALNRPDDVAQLQIALSGMGYDPGKIDGKFGGQTAKALAGYYGDHPEAMIRMGESLKAKLNAYGDTADQMALAGNPDFARAYLSGAIRNPHPDAATVAKMQLSLDRLGYKAGDADGRFGAKTATALAGFIRDNPGLAPTVAGDLRATMEGALPPQLARQAFGNADYNRNPGQDGYLLHPGVIDMLRTQPEKAPLVEMTRQAAVRYGLDPVLLVNQFFRESGGFNPNATSPAKARGISQMMPEEGLRYGLTSPADFYDPAKSIDAGARCMRDLTQQFGDQRMALVAYNGSERAIQYAEKRHGGAVDIDSLMDVLNDDNKHHHSRKPGAWSNETRDYINNIVDSFFPPDVHARAVEMNRHFSLENGETPVPGFRLPFSLPDIFAPAAQPPKTVPGRSAELGPDNKSDLGPGPLQPAFQTAVAGLAPPPPPAFTPPPRDKPGFSPPS